MIHREMVSPRPLFTTMVPSPTDPAMMARRFQFSARAAERGEHPGQHHQGGTGRGDQLHRATPNELHRMTPSRTAIAAVGLAVCGALPAPPEPTRDDRSELRPTAR